MKVLSVPGIRCSGCVKRIDAALDAANIKHTTSLDDKTVTIDDDASVETAVSELDDLGFDAEIK